MHLTTAGEKFEGKHLQNDYVQFSCYFKIIMVYKWEQLDCCNS